MKQYRITSETFAPRGEMGANDAVMSPDDLVQIKKLAGIPIVEGEGANSPSWGGYVNQTNNVPSAGEEGIASPVGSTVTNPEAYRNELLKTYNPPVGSDLWFIINFSKPHLTGSIQKQIDKYFERHPDEFQKFKDSQ